SLPMSVLSSRPDVVSGGDALVRVQVPPNVAVSDVSVRLGNVDVTSAFVPDGNGGLTGLVSGLAGGSQTLTALRVGREAGRLAVGSHPITGPIFSGPQQQPFRCEAESFRLFPNGPFLVAPLDASCSV